MLKARPLASTKGHTDKDPHDVDDDDKDDDKDDLAWCLAPGAWCLVLCNLKTLKTMKAGKLESLKT